MLISSSLQLLQSPAFPEREATPVLTMYYPQQPVTTTMTAVTVEKAISAIKTAAEEIPVSEPTIFPFRTIISDEIRRLQGRRIHFLLDNIGCSLILRPRNFLPGQSISSTSSSRGGAQ